MAMCMFCSSRQTVLQEQQQAHHPGHHLAHRGVAVGIGRSRHRQGRRQLGVTQGHEGAEQAGDDEGDHDRRPGELGGGAAGQDEDAGADDAADAQQHQVQRAQRAFQLAMLVLGVDLRHRLAPKDAPYTRAIGHPAIPFPPVTRPASEPEGRLAGRSACGNQAFAARETLRSGAKSLF
jgi:hypothetical protein